MADRLPLNKAASGWTAEKPAAAHRYPVFLASGNPYNAPAIRQLDSARPRRRANQGLLTAMADDVLILIPARMASTRLPGKPLADIAGQPMIVHVLRRARGRRLGPVVVATDAETIATAVEKAGGRAVMTRADHASGSDRIFEALGVVDPQGRARIVVNVQGDLPTLAPADIAAALDAARRPGGRHRHARRRDQQAARSATNPNVVKVVGSPVAPRPAARALFHPRHRALRATGRSIITSGSTPIAAPRWSASSRCRPRRSSSARSSSSCARWKPACASTWRSSTPCRSASIRRRIWRPPAPCSKPAVDSGRHW